MGLVLCLFGGGYAMPGTRTVTLTRSVDVRPDVLHAQITDLATWPRWSAWRVDRDPTATFTLSGESGAVGQSWDWEGERIGDGLLVITAVHPDHVAYALTFADAPASTGTLTLRPSGNGTELTWRNDLQLGNNPIMRMIGPFVATVMEADMDMGMDGLGALYPSDGEPQGSRPSADVLVDP